ncbi:MAG: glyceraldehyde 3-phosphate dehydrogenase NAD-binding domain-containing protein [Dinoroseobacter sp.]|nr:glyceraldehyde 3-phosphate dehydrogenase NAD-binding domain-containing protein [Dinoroseobacter sp.]MDJ0994702.1 glyceraldehyde 3-phosphate dehydrogenase NAD-binding domain-containing protein [Dinoroseobacter sp.]
MREFKVVINGFGRIGRSVLRAWLGGGWPGLRIVGINDIADLETCAYLFEYDSIFGPWAGEVRSDDDALIVDGKRIAFSNIANLRETDLSGVDLVMECTGRGSDRAFAERALSAGATRVLVSGPSPDADWTLVLGANDAGLTREHRIISNASCTTNALAPLAKLLDREFGIITGSMTTIHCYTGSQPTVDMPMANAARSRAAALSMVPTTTSAQALTDLVLPELAGRIEGSAVRVPVASVSAVDLSITTDAPASAEAANAAFRAAEGGILGVTAKPLVSSDLRQRPESIIMALQETRVSRGGLLRVFGWYDNEWGFSNRMLDVAMRMSKY